MSYLASSELIIEDTLGLDGAFPIVFGGLAVGMGVATFTNRRFVEAAGTWGVLRIGLTSFTGLAAVLVVIALATDGRPSAALFLPVLALVVANHAVLVPNVNAAAMEPVGAVAGTASAVLGATSMAAGAIIGAFVDGAFDGTITPLSLAFLAAGLVALGVLHRRPPRPPRRDAGRDRRRRRLTPRAPPTGRAGSTRRPPERPATARISRRTGPSRGRHRAR